MVRYYYDAWGNCSTAVVAESYRNLAEANPFRYRGYYYDTETGLYYLKSRYYDPEVGRFLIQDNLSYIDPETINGLNLYAYCGNNPIMFTDPNGTTKWWEWLLGIVIIVVAIGLSFVTAGLAAPVSAAVGGGMLGAVVGGIGGAVSYLKNTTALYRAVSADELASIKSNGGFTLKAGAMESKQFGLRLKEVKAYSKLSINKGMYSAIVKTRVPNSVLAQFTKTATDTFVFRSGVITVAANQMDLLNSALIFLKFINL